MFIQLKKKKLKNKIVPTWGSELCRVYAAIQFAIQARNTPERHLRTNSLELGEGLPLPDESPVPLVKWTRKGEVWVFLGLF